MTKSLSDGREMLTAEEVHDIIADGNRRARAVAEETMDQVRSAMGLKSSVTVV